MVDVQLQLQNIIKLVEKANTQIAEIETIILQASHNFRTQTAGNIFSISEDLQNIVQSDIENQAYHIQALLVNELGNCKGKRNEYAKVYIKKIQNVYKQDNFKLKKPVTKDKGQIQEEVLLYKPYNVDSPRSKTLKPTFIQNKIDNLEKYMKFMQIPVKTMLLYLLPYYKALRQQGEQDKQYWNKIAIAFLEKNHNTDTIRKGFPIKIYMRELPYKP